MCIARSAECIARGPQSPNHGSRAIARRVRAAPTKIGSALTDEARAALARHEALEGDVTSDDLIKYAKDVAAQELKAQGHSELHVEDLIALANEDGTVDEMLREQLESLDEDGDGDISLDEVLHFAKNFM